MIHDSSIPLRSDAIQRRQRVSSESGLVSQDAANPSSRGLQLGVDVRTSASQTAQVARLAPERNRSDGDIQPFVVESKASRPRCGSSHHRPKRCHFVGHGLMTTPGDDPSVMVGEHHGFGVQSLLAGHELQRQGNPRGLASMSSSFVVDHARTSGTKRLHHECNGGANGIRVVGESVMLER